ncbi:MAG: hypothetical protein AW06_001893 [Candidatus Accumulibacter cognatus]|uniref:Uncharacterized protein n=1 Tax=Candidatus Accumulibacter cognatus TaxID=2954383 RepID=A0A080M9C8_9PROT|nr:MAG: hypothetical protein AW06_001893 [Candidatus Accumulibacter cognatus]
MLDCCGTEIVAGLGARNEIAAAVVQFDDHIVDASLIGILKAVAITIKPNVVAESGTLQLDDQRLYVARRVNECREERIGWQYAVTAGDGDGGLRHQEVDVSGADHVIAAVIQEGRLACSDNLGIGKAVDLPDGGLHFTVVELATELGIGSQILRQQPVDSIGL